MPRMDAPARGKPRPSAGREFRQDQGQGQGREKEAESLLGDLHPGSNAVPVGVIQIVVISGPPLDSVPQVFDDPAEEALPSAMAVETTASLARLGDPVEILRVETHAELTTVSQDPSIDLVLVDRVDGETMAGWLAAIAPGGPPSVVVIADPAEEPALDAFRAGASDCIRFGPDFDRVLPVVLLEQIRRWRSERQRRVADLRIKWLENLYTGIVSEMPAALVLVDREGLILAVNQEFDRLFPPRSTGQDSEHEFLEARLPAAFIKARQKDERAVRAAARTPETSAMLVRVEVGPKKTRAYELRERRLDAEGREVLLISDVTESEWLSERLDTVRRDGQGILENINSAILVVGGDGLIGHANPAAESILGDGSGGLIGREVGEWFSRDGDRSSPIEDCLEDGTRSQGAETLLRRSDGHWVPVGVSCSPRVDASGQECGVVAVFQDLSEIKELEEQVRQSEKMASIGQLAAGVAHEVNNPMGFIHANLHQMTEYLGDLERVFEATEYLQRTIAEAGSAAEIGAASDKLAAASQEIDLGYVRKDFRKALGESVEGAERIRHIVKDLRDFSRPDLPERSAADINQALDSTANIVWTMMKHDVVLEKDYATLPKISAYPMQLKQVFMNLLVNAYQAIEARADDEPGVIRVETLAGGDEIIVRISDTGIGMEPSVRARIFEPFFTTKPVGSGTGLGLSTSYTIVERHGGRMQVTSRVGQGSCFELSLPISEDKDSVHDGAS